MMSYLSFQDYFILFSKGTVYRNKLHFSKRQDHFNHLPSHTLETTTHMLINLGQTCDEHNVTHHFLVKCFCNCSISNQKCILIFYYICVRKKKKKRSINIPWTKINVFRNWPGWVSCVFLAMLMPKRRQKLSIIKCAANLEMTSIGHTRAQWSVSWWRALPDCSQRSQFHMWDRGIFDTPTDW